MRGLFEQASMIHCKVRKRQVAKLGAVRPHLKTYVNLYSMHLNTHTNTVLNGKNIGDTEYVIGS